jgi:hypothetical protein
MKIKRLTEIEVADHKNLLVAWRSHGGIDTLVGRFIVRKPLTVSQLSRLPKALKAKLHCPDDALDFLERLAALPDLRDSVEHNDRENKPVLASSWAVSGDA